MIDHIKDTMTTMLEDEDEPDLLTRQRWLYLLALGLVVACIWVHLFLLYVLAALAVLLAVVPPLWYYRGLRRVRVDLRLDQSTHEYGDMAMMEICLENRKLLPLPWLQVSLDITPTLTVPDYQVSLQHEARKERMVDVWLCWPLQRVIRRYQIPCQARGLHILGPVQVISNDLFGWFEREQTYVLNGLLLVYPLRFPIEVLSPTLVHPLGEFSRSSFVYEDPLRIVGVRDYTPGDDPRRIHWKASARYGHLHSKIFEASATRRVLVLLDTYTYIDETKEIDGELQEFGISVAASLVQWGFDENYAVGLLTNCASYHLPEELFQPDQPAIVKREQHGGFAEIRTGPPGIYIPCALNEEQPHILFATLATLVPGQYGAMEHIIETHEQVFSSGTIVFLIATAATLNDALAEMLLEMNRRGNPVCLILLGTPTAIHTDLGHLPLHFLGGKERWHELVQHTLHNGEHDLAATLQLA